MGLWQSLFCLVCVIDSIDAIAGAIHGCLCYAISGGPFPPVNLPVVPQMYRLVDVHLDMFFLLQQGLYLDCLGSIGPC